MAGVVRMESTVAVFAFCVAVCLAVKPELTITPAGEKRQGDTVTFECTVKNAGILDFVKFVRKFGKKSYEISTNGVLNSEFVKLKRYNVIFEEPEPKTILIKLEISDIQGSDGGSIECLHNDDQTASEMITVLVPPKSVELKHFDENSMEQPVGDKLILTHGKESAIFCKIAVDGSDKEPEAKIMLDDEDITKEFEKNFVRDSESQNGLLKLKYDVDLEYRTSEPDISYSGKTLKCEGRTDGYKAVSAETVVEVQYPALFECEAAMGVKVGQGNVTITCKARAFPAPTEASWQFGDNANQTTINIPNNDDDYIATVKNSEDNMYEYSLQLRREFTADDFSTYKLVVTNPVKEVEQAINVHLFVETTPKSTSVQYEIIAPEPALTVIVTSKPPKQAENKDVTGGVGVISQNIIYFLVTVLAAWVISV